ncbi:MAG TPA: CBS domain-containing protein [Kofleriaceae bacterium]|nr:CBS domain-containing protein [Kofleriaceae bacterium]
MQAAELTQREILTCSDRDSLEHVVSLMWKHDIGCLPVTSPDGRLVGMITDRDVAMAAYLQGAPLRSITVSSVMSREVVTCRERDDVQEVERAMRQRQVRRVPVIDEVGKLLGMITINDIARAAHEGKLPSADVASTLAAISRPRLVHPQAD